MADKESSSQSQSGGAREAANAARGAIRMGKNTAKAAKTLGAAAAQAAAGNYAGAAATLAKDPETTGKVLMVLLIPMLILFFMVMCMLYALPSAIYESTISFVEHVSNTWDEVRLSNAYGDSFFLNFFATSGRLAVDGLSALGAKISEIWSGIRTFFVGGPSDNQSEQITAQASELGFAANEVTQRLAIIRKAIAVSDKYQIRAQQITNAVADKQYDINTFLTDKYKDDTDVWYTPIHTMTIVPIGTNGRDASLLLQNLEAAERSVVSATTMEDRQDAIDDFNDIVEDDFPINDNSTPISILSLAMVQQGGNVTDMKLSDMLRYVGYYTSSAGSNTSFSIGHIQEDGEQIYGYVKDWVGTFKPQYVMEEWKYFMGELAKEKFSHGADEAEMRAVVNAYENDGVALLDLLTKLDYPDLEYRGMPISNTESHYENGRQDIWTTYKSPYGNGNVVDHWWSITSLFGTTTYRQLTVNAFVTCKDIDSVVNQVGLWNGDFTVPRPAVSPAPGVTPPPRGEDY